MKKIILLTILTSCTSVEHTDLQNLNGYWEIQKVVYSDGNKTDFGTNTIYDFYQIDQTNKGIYKKVTPQLDGTFIVDDYQEEIEIVEENKIFKIKYHSEFDNREITIIEVTKNKLVIENSNQKTYYYRRAKSNLIENETYQTK